MSRAKGLFDYFSGFEDISLENIIERLNLERNSRLMQNQLCNRLFYPHAIPLTPADLKIDLEILKEIVRSCPQKYYSQSRKAIYIPEILLERFIDLAQLVWIFIEIFGQEEITTIYLKSEGSVTKSIGTLLKPKIDSNTGVVNIWVENRKYAVSVGENTLIPATESRTDIKYQSPIVTLLGKNELAMEVAGGKFGIALDLR